MAPIEAKFQIKAGMKGAVFKAPRDVSLPFPSVRKLQEGENDFVIVFVSSAADIEAVAKAAASMVREDGLLWFCYPKKTGKIKTDIHRDVGWEPVLGLGFRGVRAISIDETWSGIRFRESRFVKASC